ncbi:Ca-activated chloride channel family protein [Rhodopirellula rubra]|uniref:Ca-activated chloride channel family protein n=1 Tax=Aporhodopirellula rubra TaxID=980271 RepID=A0A7W5DWK1_9BACT|nr:tetratricopeptide repeat protein [Aporhodopirellula rubra]MBB3205841.1 Ca-activated chloride channel family protein [Aporhodopirellula rubra]
MNKITLVVLLGGITWGSLWLTPDQRGQRLMDRQQYVDAAAAFRDPMRKGVAWFRAGEFEKAQRSFARVASADAEFNRGNCLVMLGQYEPAIERYDRALKLRPDWEDARVNREIAIARAAKLNNEGGDMGDQRLGADEIRFDKKKDSEGQNTEVDDSETISDSAMQALWLRRVQTKPADFLKAKFAYQLSDQEQPEKEQ